eukprot:SAG11_NODE_38057_length_254_cov_0.658065_1_plen_43_part_01
MRLVLKISENAPTTPALHEADAFRSPPPPPPCALLFVYVCVCV